MSETQDHRSYQEALMTGLATRATGAQAVPLSTPAGPCGPVQSLPRTASLTRSNLYVIINDLRVSVSHAQLGAGPSNAPPCPDPNLYVYLQNAWHKVHTPQPVPAILHSEPRAQGPSSEIAGTIRPLAAQIRPLPRRCLSSRNPTGVPQGLSALLFGPNYMVTMHNGGAPLRMLLAVASRAALRECGCEALATAFSALVMGRIQWLGNPAQHACSSEASAPTPNAPTQIRLAGIPNAYQQALLDHRQVVGRFVRKVLGWRLVLCNNGDRLPETAASTVPRNQFAPLMPATAGPEPAVAGMPADHTAAQPDLSLLSGTVVCKHFHGRPFYGVASYTSEQEQPFVFRVRYTDGDSETMTCQELQQHKVTTWGEVPKRLQRAVRKLGGRMHIAQLSIAVPVSAYHNAIIRKKFGGRWYYGVASFLAGEPAPYVYSVAYEDGDRETMTLKTVQSHVVQSFASIPTALHARLVVLGGRAEGQPNLGQSAPQLGRNITGGQHSQAQGAQQQGERSDQPGEQQQQQPQHQQPPQHQQQQQRLRADNRRRRRRAAGRVRMANLVWCGAGLRVGYINVCGLTQLKAAELEGLLRSLNLDILAVVETWEGRCQICNIPGYVFVSKPRKGGQGGGVGFYISNTIATLITAHTNTQVPEAIWLELTSHRRGTRPVYLGAVYLPPSALTTSSNIDTAYTALQADIQAFQQKGDTIVMGDFNSRVGKANQANEHIGQWGVDEAADTAGSSLVNMLKATDLYALNGRTPNPSPEQHTPACTRSRLLTRADGTIEAQNAVLDYVIAPKIWALPHNDSHAMCALHVEEQSRLTGTDHLLLWCVVPHPISKQQTNRHTKKRANTHLLTTPGPDRGQYREDYQAAVEDMMQGYLELLQDMKHQVTAGTLTDRDAVDKAKEELIVRTNDAVANSIGFKAPAGTPGNARRPPVYTREVRAAVRTKDEANRNLLTIRNATAADPNNNEELREAQSALLDAQRAVKSAVASARNAVINKNIEAIFECESRNDGKGMWKGLQRLSGKHSGTSGGPRALQGPNGGLVMGDQQIADVLATQYERATNPTSFAANAGFDDQHKANIEDEVHTYRTSTSYNYTGPDALSAPLTIDEVEAQCSRLHNWKSPSPLDDVNNELLKYGGESMLEALTAFFDLQFQLEIKAQTPGVIKALYKRDDPTVAANYRPITLGSAIDKLYNMVLNTRICRFLEDEKALHEAQHGFRPGRSATDNIFMLNQCLSARMKQGLTTFLLFVDIEKAYDSVWRPGLLWHLWQKGIQGKLFRVLAQMTDSPTSIVLHNGAFSSPFQPGMGWEQGDTLATTMFNIYVDSVLREVWEKHQGVPLPNSDTSSPVLKLVALMYADDMAGLADTHESMQSLVNATRAALTKWRLKASVKPTDGSKTAVMVVRGGTLAARQQAARRGPAPADPLTWGDITIPQVRSYRYLGVWMSDAGTWEEHLKVRKEKTEAAAHAQHGVLSQNRLSWHLRKLTVTSVVQPVLTYAVQVWGSNTVACRKYLDNWQMQLVKRATHCPPHAQTECVQQELGILPTHIACDIYALTYWHHLRRLSSDRLLQQVAVAWSGTLNPWQQNIEKLLAEYEIDPAETADFTKSQFVNHVKTKAASRIQSLWNAGPRRTSTILQNYLTTFGPGAIKDNKPIARDYFTKLSEMRRGLAAELCLKIRLECLPLCAIHSHQRHNETFAQRTQRESCLACHNAPETLAHFLLECPAYTACRNVLFAKLQETVPNALAAIQAGPAADTWRLLFKDDVLGNDDTEEAGIEQYNINAVTAMRAVADYVCDIWKLRSAALTGRGTNEGDLMV